MLREKKKNKNGNNLPPLNIVKGHIPTKQELERKLAELIRQRKSAPLNIRPSISSKIANVKRALRKFS